MGSEDHCLRQVPRAAFAILFGLYLVYPSVIRLRLTVEQTCRPYKFRACIILYENRHSFPGQVQRLVGRSRYAAENKTK